jgi:hypothetical protein
MSTGVNIKECIKNKSMSQVLMPLFNCHKQVYALPMSRGIYNDVRGWDVPFDENTEDEGYLVVYNCGTEDEYVSWSPKHVFDDGYTEYKEKPNKVAFEHIQSMINSLEFKFARVEETTVTGCWAFLPNGFQVAYGESACVDPNNFDFELGKKYAKERCLQAATNKLWELEGYLLATTGVTSDYL